MSTSLDAADRNTTDNNLEVGESWVSRKIRMRYGILMLLALAGWTLLGYWPMLEGIPVNEMLFDSYTQLTFLS